MQGTAFECLTVPAAPHLSLVLVAEENLWAPRYNLLSNLFFAELTFGDLNCPTKVVSLDWTNIKIKNCSHFFFPFDNRTKPSRHTIVLLTPWKGNNYSLIIYQNFQKHKTSKNHLIIIVNSLTTLTHSCKIRAFILDLHFNKHSNDKWELKYYNFHLNLNLICSN